MQLLKPIMVTMAGNLTKDKQLINENLVGQAVMGWIEMKQYVENGEQKMFPQVMFGVVWTGRTLTPAMSVYKNEELAQMGLAEEFEVNEESDEDDDYDEDEAQSDMTV